jgi:hypothetical protein
MAASVAVPAIGPMCATLQHNGTAPNSLTRPYVGLSPTSPKNMSNFFGLLFVKVRHFGAFADYRNINIF